MIRADTQTGQAIVCEQNYRPNDDEFYDCSQQEPSAAAPGKLKSTKTIQGMEIEGGLKMLLREWFKAQRRRAPQENHVHGYQYAAGCLLAGAKVETIEALCCCDEEFDAGMLHAINDWELLMQRLRVAA